MCIGSIRPRAKLLDLIVDRMRDVCVLLLIDLPSRIPAALGRSATCHGAGAQPAGERDGEAMVESLAGNKPLPAGIRRRSSSAPTACRCLSRR